MKHFITSILLSATFAVTAVAQTTTIEEYKYITIGYPIQLEAGLDMKKGYELQDVGEQSSGKSKVMLKKLIKMVGNIKTTVAYMLTYDNESSSTEYICIPHPDSDEEILGLYWKALWDTYDSQTDSKVRLRLIAYLLSHNLEWERQACFGKGTKISLSSNKTKNIEDLVIGDTVLTYEVKKNEFSTGIIEKLEKVNHTHLVSYVFDNGQNIISTQDHPLMVINKGWGSLQPDKSKQYEGFEQIKKVEIGDLFEMVGTDGKLTANKLLKIEYLNEEQETHTISKLSFGNNFIANGLIVGVEKNNNIRTRLVSAPTENSCGL